MMALALPIPQKTTLLDIKPPSSKKNRRHFVKQKGSSKSNARSKMWGRNMGTCEATQAFKPVSSSLQIIRFFNMAWALEFFVRIFAMRKSREQTTLAQVRADPGWLKSAALKLRTTHEHLHLVVGQHTRDVPRGDLRQGPCPLQHRAPPLSLTRGQHDPPIHPHIELLPSVLPFGPDAASSSPPPSSEKKATG